ncbi:MULTISPECIES: TRAP transporter large permease [Halocynthiibacter]|uniref:TRAP transporter large permease protein n=1 Tax=Halocynthiibacter halioticoli TaxID=2986804 RepID=A0AAE3LQU0_9RHOB|nr:MULTISPECIES: TRAP transporter large permease subunit [Halocynthiibacter]MCV6824832.1 TRAP transporter large permease subunit [Halocynthiibacter halioticoli]MCW4057833.1 TRAP transporter large permease subunit [Halocynthiibacter sp. SDUM655004]
MDPITIGMLSVGAIVVLVYLGLYIPVALGLVSFVSIWIMSGKSILAFNFLKVAVGDGVTEYNFATIPLFTLMGLLVSKARLGRDIYDVMNSAFHRVLAGVGMATVGANAVFAAITGSSIASASVFTKIAVPQMLRYKYNKRFAVGVVAGSSVLGMIIPPSAMLIIYSFVAEQSVGDMFLAGIIPGLILTAVYIFAIFLMARFWPSFIGDDISAEDMTPMSGREMFKKAWPVVALILLVLGGIYNGWLTPVEAGAAGASLALVIAVLRRSMSWKGFWETLVETGHITAAILLLVTMASFYSRMLGYAGLPNQLDAVLQSWDLSFFQIMALYVLLMLVLGTLLDTSSIILIVVPLFITLIESMGLSLVWFGIVTVIGAEIGLLTPPLGISCFVIKSTLDDPNISLKDVFLGSLPFAFLMLLVLILIIQFPILSVALL